MANILVTDDAAFMRKVLADVLIKCGHDVDEACDGRDAVDKSKAKDYDLITLDITMPNMDGIQALKRIRANKPAQRCIMVSAMGQQTMVIEAIQNGAKDFVVKPFQADRVKEAVSKALE